MNVHEGVGRIDHGGEVTSCCDCEELNSGHKVCTLFLFLFLLIGVFLVLAVVLATPVNAQTTNLTVEIVSWDRIGIDANNPLKGPNMTEIQAKICNSGPSTATNVTVNFTWSDSIETYIYLVSGEQMVKNLGTLEPGTCTDVFFLVGMNRSSATIGKTRTYTLTVTSNQSDPETASQTLTVVGLIGSNSQYSTLMNVSDYSPAKCSNFQVSVWDNVTQADPGNQIGFPVTYYDPTVIELVNVTVQSYNSKFIYVGTYYSLLSHITGKSYHYITYTFHARSYGDDVISFIVQTGSPYKYNNDYGDASVSVNVTLNLGDYVWDDLNYNGVQEVGEPGIANVTVNLSYYDNPYIGTTETNATGYYLFSDLYAGNYTLQFVPPPNYSFTPQNAGADDTIDSDANATGWTTVPIWLSSEHNYTWDAGLYRNASIGDYVWNDQNGNGIQDGAGVVIGKPVTVHLYSSTNTTTPIKTVTANTTTGKYLFTDLMPGGYYVEFVNPDPVNYTFSPQDNGFDDAKDSDANATGWTDLITLASGEYNETIDAGLHQGTALGSFVWHDLNGNGIQDVGEPGIGNVTVNLYNESFGHVATTSTYEDGNDTGYYGFGGLPPNTTYYIEFVLPTGYVFTLRYQGDYINDSNANATGWTGPITTPASGGVNLTIDAGLIRLASLGGYVWKDLNANGVQDPGFYAFGGVNVTLFNSTMVEIANTTTNSTVGFNYLFPNLTPGGYYVKFEKPDGWDFSPKDYDPNDTIDSDANETGWTDLITLASGELNDTTDAGLHQGTGLAKFVWHDLNANGIQDDGEPGIHNVTVNLYNASKGYINFTTTINGYYGFGNLSPNTTYYIEFVLPPDYDFFSPQYQGDYRNDSDANATGWAIAITPSAGLVNGTIDAGMYRTASLGDFVWEDLNANGLQEGGELGIHNVTVYLYNASKEHINTTNTSGGGNYSFGNLTPNTTYYIQFELPTGYVFSPRYQSNYTNDSNANATGWTDAIITPLSGLNDTTIDAGLYLGALIGDFVWLDCNDDGIQNESEPGVGNVTVELYCCMGGHIGTTKTDETGYYRFSNLKPGNYSLFFALPPGYVSWTLEDQGSDNSKDSDVGFYGYSDLIPLGYNVTSLIWDAGINTFADLNVTKKVDSPKPFYYPGDNITFNITVCNIGNVTLNNVTLNDSKLNLTNFSFRTLVPGACNWTEYNHTVNATDACRGWINNTVNVTANDMCGIAVWNETDANVTNILYNTSLNVTKRVVSEGPYYPGDTITYNITVCNTGNVTISYVTITDPLLGTFNTTNLTKKDCWILNKTYNVTPADCAIGWINNTVRVNGTDYCGKNVTGASASWNVTVECGYCISGYKLNTSDGGLAGWTINVTNSSGVVVGSNVTDATGYWQVCGLAPGNYTVCEVPQSGWIAVDPGTGCHENITINDTDWTNVNFTNRKRDGGNGEVKVSCISGYKLNESSGLGLAGWTINVTNSSGVVVGSNVTGATGYWQVCDLPTGNYTVCEVPQSGWIAVDPGTGCHENITINDTDWTNVNFTNRKEVNVSCISGYKLNESSGLGLAGWTINVTNSSGVVVGSNVTDATGYWQVCDLPTGNYTVCEELQQGWMIIEPEFGCQNVSLGTANFTGLNFTNSECNGSISDFVWLDENKNGIQDVNESGIAGVRVNLYLHASPETLYGWTYTNGTGYYLFGKLCEGNYSLQFIPPPGFVFTLKNQGDDTTDSDVDPTTGRTEVFYLGSGEVNTTIDAGLYYLPEQVPAFTPIGLIALVSSLSAIAALSLRVRKRG